jgi:hypothetical protein
MTASHTPGPWGCCDTSYHAHDYRLTKPNGEPLPVNAPYNDHSEQRANARLIALAPEMLEALRDALDFLEDAGEYPNTSRRIRALIARAKGED